MEPENQVSHGIGRYLAVCGHFPVTLVLGVLVENEVLEILAEHGGNLLNFVLRKVDSSNYITVNEELTKNNVSPSQDALSSVQINLAARAKRATPRSSINQKVSIEKTPDFERREKKQERKFEPKLESETQVELWKPTRAI